MKYKVHVQQQLWKGFPAVQARQGTCDINLGAQGIQTGVPDVYKGDVATAIIMHPATEVPFLEGVVW